MAKARDLIRAETYVRHFGMKVLYLLPMTFVAMTIALPMNNDPGKTSLNITATDINFLRRYGSRGKIPILNHLSTPIRVCFT